MVDVGADRLCGSLCSPRGVVHSATQMSDDYGIISAVAGASAVEKYGRCDREYYIQTG